MVAKTLRTTPPDRDVTANHYVVAASTEGGDR